MEPLRVSVETFRTQLGDVRTAPKDNATKAKGSRGQMMSSRLQPPDMSEKAQEKLVHANPLAAVLRDELSRLQEHSSQVAKNARIHEEVSSATALKDLMQQAAEVQSALQAVESGRGIGSAGQTASVTSRDAS